MADLPFLFHPPSAPFPPHDTYFVVVKQGAFFDKKGEICKWSRRRLYNVDLGKGVTVHAEDILFH